MTSAKDDPERLARVALNALGEPGDPRMAALVAEHGASTIRDRLLAGRHAAGLESEAAGRLAGLDPRRDLALASRRDVRFVIPGDDEWPKWIDDLQSATPVQQRGGVPLGLWVRGPTRLNELFGSIAVVGTRSASGYGIDCAGVLAAGAARSGHPVVSGAAFGVDQAAHRGALAGGGPTVAVLAGGVDRPYPQAHRALIEHIATVGAVVSEAPLGAASHRRRFLARNRLIAGLTRGTVVVEAAIRSGALNTANWADRLSRNVMGVPGPVTSASSQGVHELIRGGSATLVTCPEDVLELIGAAGTNLAEDRRGPSRSHDQLSLRQQQVLDAVPVFDPAGAESIARAAGMSLREVTSSLDDLVRARLVVRVGDCWRLRPSVDQSPPD
jgi:DNA processing protein